MSLSWQWTVLVPTTNLTIIKRNIYKNKNRKTSPSYARINGMTDIRLGKKEDLVTLNATPLKLMPPAYSIHTFLHMH